MVLIKYWLIDNIKVLAVYSTGYVGWLITYEWVAGDLLCKIMRFLDVLIFSARWELLVSSLPWQFERARTSLEDYLIESANSKVYFRILFYHFLLTSDYWSVTATPNSKVNGAVKNWKELSCIHTFCFSAFHYLRRSQFDAVTHPQKSKNEGNRTLYKFFFTDNSSDNATFTVCREVCC